MIRKVYDIAAVFSLLNMLAIAGVGGFLAWSGVFDKGKLQRALAAYHAKDGSSTTTTGSAPMTSQLDAGAMTSADAPPAPASVVVQSAEDVEVLRREADRLAVEMEQRLALTKSMILNVTTEREALTREREAFQKEREAAARKISTAVRETEGFKRQVEIFEGMNPKSAMEYLVGMNDPESAAVLLSSIEARKANKIVEAAKNGPNQKLIHEILQKVRDVAPERSPDLSAETVP